ncbi:MAG: DUF4199 domain-containing protein [Bacteroidales bacterium]|jgi:hypothetical protein|nr:DUF4199 domain-containing protein [Bacteroidales bacterium]
MEEKVRSTTVQGLYYGLITGIGLILLSLILYIAGLYMNKWLSSISYLILIGGVVYGTVDYRKNYLNGYMTYGKAFTLCFLIGLFAGLLAAIYTFLFAQFIHPGFVGEILEQSRQQMVTTSPNMSEEQIESALAMTAKFTSPVMMMVFGAITYAVLSAVLGLVAAIFLKKEDPSLTSSM